jgi:hypothetical protein
MGTTLAFTGAYNLAASLLSHPSDPDTAFTSYESKMRPVVAKAQKLFPGAPHSMWPETERGIWRLHALFWAVKASGLVRLLFVIAWVVNWLGVGRVLSNIGGPPAAEVELEEFGFRQLEEWDGSEKS